MLVHERSDPTHSSWGFGVPIKPREDLLWVKYTAGKNVQFHKYWHSEASSIHGFKTRKSWQIQKKVHIIFFFFWQEIQPNKANTNSTSQGIIDSQACLLTCSPFMLAKHTRKTPIKWPEKFKFILKRSDNICNPCWWAESSCSRRWFSCAYRREEKNTKTKARGITAHPKCEEKNKTKTCVLLRTLRKGSFPLIQNCHASQGSSNHTGRLAGGRAARGSFRMHLLRQCMDKSKGIAFLGDI